MSSFFCTNFWVEISIPKILSSRIFSSYPLFPGICGRWSSLVSLLCLTSFILCRLFFLFLFLNFYSRRSFPVFSRILRLDRQMLQLFWNLRLVPLFLWIYPNWVKIRVYNSLYKYLRPFGLNVVICNVQVFS